ncbi:amidohydrolase family protein [Rhodococcus erythropolis]|uniref:amidohydrolase family protein n=1 Tax=Rhodococcus erythropolis TaxID=1833 RepID=UPI001BED0FB8|nr:amidohydrolase family protein [Rhodococcus erythropolis]MBT2266114.1 amidohydrolase family protein [Rhodococcus erythropolis]
MIIDTHTHLLDYGHWPEEWWDWVAADWAGQKPDRIPSQVRDRIETGLVDPDATRMLQRMDEANVDISVLLPIDWGLDFTTRAPITAAVDKMLELASISDGKLIAFGGIDPRRPNAKELVVEWFERGVRGLKLYPGCGWNPTSDEAMEIYALCESRGAPVLFHTGHPLPVLDAESSNPSLLKDVAVTFPGMPLWLGHAGAPIWWDEALEVAESGPNVKLEMSVWLWDDSDTAAEVEFTRKVLQAGDRVGFERVLFGTDHVSGAKVRPAEFLKTVTDMFLRLPEHAHALGRQISPEQMASIMGNSAARDLGLPV